MALGFEIHKTGKGGTTNIDHVAPRGFGHVQMRSGDVVDIYHGGQRSYVITDAYRTDLLEVSEGVVVQTYDESDGELPRHLMFTSVGQKATLQSSEPTDGVSYPNPRSTERLTVIAQLPPK